MHGLDWVFVFVSLGVFGYALVDLLDKIAVRLEAIRKLIDDRNEADNVNERVAAKRFPDLYR